MDSYCDINNAYSNKGILNNNSNPSSHDLEKLARQVNNSKRTKSKDIYRQYRKGSEELDRSSQSFDEFLAAQSDKGTKISPYFLNASQSVADSGNLPTKDIRKGSKKPVTGFYSAQGEYAEFNGNNDIGANLMNFNYEPKNMSESLIHGVVKDGHKKKIIDDGSDGISLDTPSDGDSNSSESSFSSMTWDTKEIDRHIKSKSKFNSNKRSKRHKCMDFDIDSVDSLESLDSGESLLRHIRFCKECKDKVMGLIRKHKNDSHKFIKNDKNKLKCAHILDSVKDDDCMDLEIFDPIRSKSSKIETMKSESINITKNNKNGCDNQNNDQANYQCDNTISGIRFPEIKEIVTVCLVGFLIIVVLDLMMRNK